MTGEGKRWGRLRDHPWSSLSLYCGWKRNRPEWFVVDGSFRQRMLDKAEATIRDNKRESLTGAAVRKHGEAEAAGLLEKGLASQTLVATDRIAKMLHMGHRSNVSAAKKWVRETKQGSKWLRKLV